MLYRSLERELLSLSLSPWGSKYISQEVNFFFSQSVSQSVSLFFFLPSLSLPQISLTQNVNYVSKPRLAYLSCNETQGGFG